MSLQPINLRRILAPFFLLLMTVTHATASPLQYEIKGVSDAAKENVIARLRPITPQKTQASKIDHQQTTIFLEDSIPQIKRALQPFGYFHTTVSIHRINTLEGTPVIQFEISPGPRILITTFKLTIKGEGKNLPVFSRLLKYFKRTIGKPFTVPLYEKQQQILFITAHNAGFPHATLTSKHVDINPINNTARITLIFNTGARYYFGKIQFSKIHFAPQFLQRFIPFPYHPTSRNHKKTIYSSAYLQQLQENLNNSNYFAYVQVDPKLPSQKTKHQQKATHQDTTIPVKVTLKAKKARQYRFSLGYGTDTRLRGAVGMTFRHLGSMGHHFDIQYQTSQRDNTLQSRYIIPGMNPLKDQYSINASIQNSDLTMGRFKVYTTGLSALHTLAMGWKQSVSLNFEHEFSRPKNAPNSTDNSLIPSISWLKTNSNDPLCPSKGYRLHASVEGSSQALLSHNTFISTKVDGKLIEPIFTRLSHHNRIVTRATLGYIDTNNVNNLPLSHQFFTGGSTSIRGYTYQSIGTGHALYTGSLGLEHAIVPHVYLGAFYDVGNVSNHFFKKFKRGTGINITWASPIGAINLSYAKALNLPGQPMRFQLSMGPAL